MVKRPRNNPKGERGPQNPISKTMKTTPLLIVSLAHSDSNPILGCAPWIEDKAKLNEVAKSIIEFGLGVDSFILSQEIDFRCVESGSFCAEVTDENEQFYEIELFRSNLIQLE